MNCFSQILTWCSYGLESLGLYEPEINITEAKQRLNQEGQIWEKYQNDKAETWHEFQENNEINGEPTPLVKKAIAHLDDLKLQKGVAVDLGCGISSNTFHLLELGWKVYAVDSSKFVTDSIEKRVSQMATNWIKKGLLIIVNQPIESFDYPEKVHLITATESLPYCDPRKICDIFLKAKNALHSQGTLVCNLFPYSDHPMGDQMLRGVFGAWMTTRNVVDAIMRSVDFPSYSVDNGKSPAGLAKQFHIMAKKIY